MNKLLFLCAVLLLVGCGSQHDKLEASDDLGSMNIEPIEGEAIFFEDVFDSIIKNDCLVCHQNYDSVSTVSSSAENILERIKGEGFGTPMPLGGPPLTNEQIFIFENWIAQGLIE